MASSSITVLIVLLLALVLVHYPVLMPVLSLAALAAAAACCIRRSVDPSNTCKRPVAQLTTGSVDDCLQEVITLQYRPNTPAARPRLTATDHNA